MSENHRRYRGEGDGEFRGTEFREELVSEDLLTGVPFEGGELRPSLDERLEAVDTFP